MLAPVARAITTPLPAPARPALRVSRRRGRRTRKAVPVRRPLPGSPARERCRRTGRNAVRHPRRPRNVELRVVEVRQWSAEIRQLVQPALPLDEEPDVARRQCVAHPQAPGACELRLVTAGGADRMQRYRTRADEE